MACYKCNTKIRAKIDKLLEARFKDENSLLDSSLTVKERKAVKKAIRLKYDAKIKRIDPTWKNHLKYKT